jgi:hypothetical protein
MPDLCSLVNLFIILLNCFYRQWSTGNNRVINFFFWPYYLFLLHYCIVSFDWSVWVFMYHCATDRRLCEIVLTDPQNVGNCGIVNIACWLSSSIILVFVHLWPGIVFLCKASSHIVEVRVVFVLYALIYCIYITDFQISYLYNFRYIL